jgi:geranyl-CoA carboxylase alpha subunit
MVSPFYDPMVAKIIAYGEDRDTARRRLLRALRQTVLFGIATNREFLIDVLERESFASGEATTAFIEEEFPEGVHQSLPLEQELSVAALLQYLEGEESSLYERVSDDALLSGTFGERGIPSVFAYKVDEELQTVSVLTKGSDCYEVSVGGTQLQLELIGSSREGYLRLAIDGIQQDVAYCFVGHSTVALQWHGRAFVLANELGLSATDRDAEGSGAVLAPMHGNLLALRVTAGATVFRGDELAIIEAMKMEHRLLAQVDGVVSAIYGVEGEQIAAGALVLEIEPAAE